QETVAPHTPPPGDTTATGPVTIGSAQTSATPANAWNGTIESPVLVQEILNTTTIKNLYTTY
ncbi:hypothetical protein, partial [Microbacterium panaciterrae]|uniref:hypothetical protein n=1 Tax=Microbacterium panaciterrae TaxID=985759 RepID=UPI0031ECE35F